jgi:hypothetical protein
MSAAPGVPTTTEVDRGRFTSNAARRGLRFGLVLAGALVTVALTAPTALASTDFPPGPIATDYPPGPTATDDPPGPTATDVPPGPTATDLPPGRRATDDSATLDGTIPRH